MPLERLSSVNAQKRYFNDLNRQGTMLGILSTTTYNNG